MKMDPTAERLYGEVADDLERFLKDYCSDELSKLWRQYPSEKSDIWIDFADLATYDSYLADIVVGRIEEYSLSHLTKATQRVVEEIDNPVSASVEADELTARIYNLGEPHTLDVGEYWSEDLGSYVSVTGQISKATPPRPKYKELAFRCVRCETLTRVPQLGEQKNEPDKCRSCERKGPFMEDDEHSKAVDRQRLRLEELPENVRGDNADTIDVEIEGELVKWLAEHDVKSGSRVTVTGVLGTDKGDGTVADNWLLEAEAVEVEEDDLNADDITQEERETIRAYANGERGDPIKLLGESIAPTLKGHEPVEVVEYDGGQWTKMRWIKTMGALAHLFQGWRKPNGDGTYQRGTSHMLLIGDPSTGKSTLMRSIERLSPRSASTSGKGATAAGMTAAAVKDDFGDSQWNLEAGVLVKGHGGMAAVDEIDKIDPDAVESMHTALEQQQINVSKAGIHATLPCETSLLAAGNPTESRFTDYEDEFEQIDLVESLMDRFDLVWTLRDEPDEERDGDLADHVIDQRTRAAKNERGELDPDETGADVPIDPELLVKWVKISREVKPRIEDSAVADVLRDFYVSIRQEGEGDGPVPATVRDLDGLLRLAEASARFRLSEEIEMRDAKLAIAGVKASLYDVGYDEDSGTIDIDAVQGNTSWTQRDRRSKIKGLVDQLDGGDGAEVENVVETAESAGIEPENAEHAIEKMKQKGELWSPSTGRVRVA